MIDEHVPFIARIDSNNEEARGVRNFIFSIPGDSMFSYKPGQFIMLSVFGYGEAAFAPSSFPAKNNSIEVTVASVGRLTAQLFSMEPGDTVGIRGPFGNGFNLDKVKGKNIIIVAGGMGMSALKPLIEAIFLDRNSFNKIEILYGAKTLSDMPFRKELGFWSEIKNVSIEITVDFPDKNWKGRRGVVGSLLDNMKIDSENTFAFVCGPHSMLPSVFKRLIKMKMKKNHIITSLERQMKCGIGFCGHCRIKDKYVCTDGPVFSYDEIEGYIEI